MSNFEITTSAKEVVILHTPAEGVAIEHFSDDWYAPIQADGSASRKSPGALLKELARVMLVTKQITSQEHARLEIEIDSRLEVVNLIP